MVIVCCDWGYVEMLNHVKDSRINGETKGHIHSLHQSLSVAAYSVHEMQGTNGSKHITHSKFNQLASKHTTH